MSADFNSETLWSQQGGDFRVRGGDGKTLCSQQTSSQLWAASSGWNKKFKEIRQVQSGLTVWNCVSHQKHIKMWFDTDREPMEGSWFFKLHYSEAVEELEQAYERSVSHWHKGRWNGQKCLGDIVPWKQRIEYNMSEYVLCTVLYVCTM